MPDAAPLHPNLARIAAAYDNVVERYASGVLTAAQAKAELNSLQARDDQGVVWAIDPHTGDWRRRTRAGDWVLDRPPAYGLATPTAHDLSNATGTFNPDSRILRSLVDESALAANGNLAGATRRHLAGAAQPASSGPGMRASAAVAVVAVLAGGWWWMHARPAPVQPARPTAPVTTITPAPAATAHR